MLCVAVPDHIFEIIDCIFLGFELVGVEGHGDVVEGLVYEQAGVQFESDGGEIGNLIQGFKRLMDVSPRSGYQLGQRFGNSKSG